MIRTLLASLLIATSAMASPLPSHLVDGRDMLELQREGAPLDKWQQTYGTPLPPGIKIVFAMPEAIVRIKFDNEPLGQFELPANYVQIAVAYEYEFDLFDAVFDLFGAWWEVPLDVTADPDPQAFAAPGPVNTPVELFIGPLKIHQYMLIPELAGWLLTLAGLACGVLTKTRNYKEGE